MSCVQNYTDASMGVSMHVFSSRSLGLALGCGVLPIKPVNLQMRRGYTGRHACRQLSHSL